GLRPPSPARGRRKGKGSGTTSPACGRGRRATARRVRAPCVTPSRPMTCTARHASVPIRTLVPDPHEACEARLAGARQAVVAIGHKTADLRWCCPLRVAQPAAETEAHAIGPLDLERSHHAGVL